jgi:D-alanine-D-alanine ligase-like ATP-grasp enzyme
VEVNDKAVSGRIKSICKTFYKAMSMESYARIDLRMNSKDEIFVLEINPVPSMFYAENEYSSAD